MMSALYETDKLLSEYLLFHYGQDDEILPAGGHWPAGMREALGFPVRTADHFSPGSVESALDLGCAVGRTTFELSRQCKRVVGIDFSQAFIAAASALRHGEVLSYERLEEGHVRAQLTARAPEGVDGSRIDFLQGDAMNLPESLKDFDQVHAANLLCRLPDPKRLLDRLPSLVKPGGELVLATPCTWLEEFTPAENWPVSSTLGWLLESLSPNFEITREAEEPFLIRETARKFQWSSSLVTVWKRL